MLAEGKFIPPLHPPFCASTPLFCTNPHWAGWSLLVTESSIWQKLFEILRKTITTFKYKRSKCEKALKLITWFTILEGKIRRKRFLPRAQPTSVYQPTYLSQPTTPHYSLLRNTIYLLIQDEPKGSKPVPTIMKWICFMIQWIFICIQLTNFLDTDSTFQYPEQCPKVIPDINLQMPTIYGNVNNGSLTI